MRRVRLGGSLYHPTVPVGAVVICRPTRWGNPFPTRRFGLTTAVALYAGWLAGHRPTVGLAHTLGCRLRHHGPALQALAARHLAGVDLACWCPPGTPCHGDVLIAALTHPTTWSTLMSNPDPSTPARGDESAPLRETLRSLVADGTLTPAEAANLWPADDFQPIARWAAAWFDADGW